MSKPTTDKLGEIDVVEDTEQDIGAEDYGFVFDSEGNLKYAFVPEVMFDNYLYVFY